VISFSWDFPAIFLKGKIKHQFIIILGAGGFQNIFYLIDEKRKITSSKIPF
jgi:hypothetical protein